MNLPPGFSIKPIATEDHRLYPAAVQSVFNRHATAEQDEFLQQAPSHVPDLHLLVWSDQGEVAAFCSPLLILEAMKMEHTITAPAAGTVKSYCYAAGEQIVDGAALVEFEGMT